MAEQMSMPIEQLDLTVRSYNCLKRESVHTVGELLGSEADLMDSRLWPGSRSMRSKAKLRSMGRCAQGPSRFDPAAAVAFLRRQRAAYAERAALAIHRYFVGAKWCADYS